MSGIESSNDAEANVDIRPRGVIPAVTMVIGLAVAQVLFLLVLGLGPMSEPGDPLIAVVVVGIWGSVMVGLCLPIVWGRNGFRITTIVLCSINLGYGGIGVLAATFDTFAESRTGLGVALAIVGGILAADAIAVIVLLGRYEVRVWCWQRSDKIIRVRSADAPAETIRIARGDNGHETFIRRPGSRNGFGRAALTLGIISGVMVLQAEQPPQPSPANPNPSVSPGTLMMTILLAVMPIVFGHIGRYRAREGEASNPGVALSGLILGYVAFGLGVLFVTPYL